MKILLGLHPLSSHHMPKWVYFEYSTLLCFTFDISRYYLKLRHYMHIELVRKKYSSDILDIHAQQDQTNVFLFSDKYVCHSLVVHVSSPRWQAPGSCAMHQMADIHQHFQNLNCI